MKIKKIISSLLIICIFFGTSIPKTFANNDIPQEFYNKNTKIELTKEAEDYKLFYDKISNVKYLVYKSNNLSDKRKEEISKEVGMNIRDKIMVETCIAIILGIVAIVDLSVTIDSTYFKEDRDSRNALNQIKNGWAELKQNGKKLWFYKENGNLKKGWFYDNNYKGWYYFADNGVMFDPKYANSSWIRTNNKWYEFNIGGKLIEHSCWRKYNNKWMYHIPEDFGAIAGSKIKSGDQWYEFDNNGYLKEYLEIDSNGYPK